MQLYVCINYSQQWYKVGGVGIVILKREGLFG